jgi:hypothetical protein
MVQYTLNWPNDFQDYAWEIESKGWFAGLEIILDGKALKPIFCDAARLSQDVAGELSSSGFFFEPCLVVVERVSRESIEDAIKNLARTGALARLAKLLNC